MGKQTIEIKKVSEIRKLYMYGKTRKEISVKLDIKYITICKILARKGSYKKQGRRRGEVKLDVY